MVNLVYSATFTSFYEHYFTHFLCYIQLLADELSDHGLVSQLRFVRLVRELVAASKAWIVVRRQLLDGFLIQI